MAHDTSLLWTETQCTVVAVHINETESQVVSCEGSSSLCPGTYDPCATAPVSSCCGGPNNQELCSVAVVRDYVATATLDYDIGKKEYTEEVVVECSRFTQTENDQCRSRTPIFHVDEGDDVQCWVKNSDRDTVVLVEPANATVYIIGAVLFGAVTLFFCFPRRRTAEVGAKKSKKGKRGRKNAGRELVASDDEDV